MVFGKDKNLQTVIAQNNRDPFFILEQNGEIITSNSPGASLLLVEDRDAFLQRYGAAMEESIGGQYGGALANGGETITLAMMR